MSQNILGTKIDCVTANDAQEKIKKRLATGERTAMFTPNLLMMGQSVKNGEKNILNRGGLNVADGSGAYLALKMRGVKEARRTAGIDVARSALATAAQHGLKVYLLGGKKGIAERAAEMLRSEIDGLCICGTHHGYFDTSPQSTDTADVISDIAKRHADILVVCLGYPKQEQFILDAYGRLDGVRLFMALGGSLDVWSKNVRRAPKVMQSMHLEWLWRCIMQPAKIKTALPLPLYFVRAVLER